MDNWEEQDTSKSRALMQMLQAVFMKLLFSKIYEKPWNLHVLQEQYTVLSCVNYGVKWLYFQALHSSRNTTSKTRFLE